MEQLDNSVVTRRRFLGGVGGAAAVVGGLLYPGITQAARLARADGLPAQTLEGPDPGFALGEVVTKTSEGIVVQTETTARAVRIQPGNSVWKEYLTTSDVIQLGDFVHARGVPQTDGSLAATPGWLWVNIGMSSGIIQAADSNGVHLGGRPGVTPHRVTFSPGLEVIHASDESPVTGHVSALRPGMAIGSVGLQLPDGSLRATRIWI